MINFEITGMSVLVGVLFGLIIPLGYPPNTDILSSKNTRVFCTFSLFFQPETSFHLRILNRSPLCEHIRMKKIWCRINKKKLKFPISTLIHKFEKACDFLCFMILVKYVFVVRDFEVHEPHNM